LSPDDPAFALTDEEIKEKFLEAIARMYPAFEKSDVVAFRVSRVRYVFPIPTLNYSEKLPATSTSIEGLHVINSAHIVNGTLNVNETVQLAEKSAARLLSLPARARSLNISSEVVNEYEEEAICQPVLRP
jgi:protoporphyrinogen oxidase